MTTTTTTQTTTCGRMIAALDHDDRRSLRPCVKVTGHVGHCHYNAPRTRSTVSICPPFCAGHSADGGFQGWEGDGVTVERSHGEEAVAVVGEGFEVGVAVTVTEDADHRLTTPRVFVYVEELSAPADLTPAQARGVAACLLAAADRAEAGTSVSA